MNILDIIQFYKTTVFRYLIGDRNEFCGFISFSLHRDCCNVIGALLLETITRHTMNPWEKDIGYAEVVEANGTVYVSGVVCGGEGDSYAKAVPECYAQLAGILTKLKLTPKNIVKENVYAKNIDAFKEQIPARRPFMETIITPLPLGLRSAGFICQCNWWKLNWLRCVPNNLFR